MVKAKLLLFCATFSCFAPGLNFSDELAKLRAAHRGCCDVNNGTTERRRCRDAMEGYTKSEDPRLSGEAAHLLERTPFIISNY